MDHSGVPMPWRQAEGNTTGVVSARRTRTLRGLRPRARTKAPRTGTGRSHDRLRRDGLQAAPGSLRTQAVNDGRGKSDGAVVPGKQPNRAGEPAAEAMEGRDQPRGTLPSATRSGHKAGQARQARSSGYVRPPRRIGGLPAVLADLGDGGCREVQVVGQEHQRRAVVADELDPPQQMGAVLLRLDARQADHVVADHATVLRDRSLLDHLVGGVVLHPGDEPDPLVVPATEQLVVDVAAVDDQHAVRRQFQRLSDADVVDLASGDHAERRQVAGVIQQGRNLAQSSSARHRSITVESSEYSLLPPAPRGATIS